MNFMGYLRPDGTVGVRNHVAVLPAINCMNDAAYRLAEKCGAVALCHSLVCTHAKEDKERAERALIGMGRNPNIAAVLVLGVGCEPYKADYLANEIAKSGKQVLALSISTHDYDDIISKGASFLDLQIEAARSQQRVPCDVSSLMIGIKCGGSSPISAISNNAAVGRAMDILIGEGGSAIFSETVEILGADKVLAANAATPACAKKLENTVNKLKANIAGYGVDLLGSEPTEGNILSGLTTIEEKSLGAIVKAGTTPLQDVLEFAEKPLTKGLFFMDCEAAGDSVFAGAMGAGSQIGLFSIANGYGTRFRGMPSCSSSGIFAYPTLKVLGSNRDDSQKDYFDCYVGGMISGEETLSEAGEKLFQTILQIASGKLTFTESYNKYYGTIPLGRNSLVM